MRFWCWHLGKPAGFHPSQAAVGPAAASSNTGSVKAGVQPPDRKWKGWNWVCVQEELTLTGPHFLFLTCGTSFVFSILKQDPAGPQPRPPGGYFCQGWYCPQASAVWISGCRAGINTAHFPGRETAERESGASRLETRTPKTEIKKKKKGVGHILNIEAWPKWKRSHLTLQCYSGSWALVLWMRKITAALDK